ncbi:BTB/POZ domain-containing protein At1g04390 isoform X2 [Syzygium oleosum]|uniref:BTB/POZ domain-containing protein At1g04390 isoform X2 n=1 Tax=Syzygium oleosum TaxID=219896 RepID=UPI0024B89CC4|nr:BTB/POZ domain-containing protein At1g04390 isoform X2 [Syzygium oleosum]
MKASKRRAETRSVQLNTLHHRLRDALHLCTRCRDGGRTRWECRDIETQRYVLRSIVAFLDCVSEETSGNPLLKDSAEDIVGALVGILHQKSEATTSIAADAVCKLASVLATSILQPHLPDLVHPLSSLSISPQLQVAVPSSRALSVMLSNLSKKKENEVWEVLDKEDITTHLIKNILNFSASTSSNVYFQEMLALLAIILLRWPQSRYQVWSNVSFMNMLEDFCVNPDPSLGVALLKLYTATALCSYGAKKILEHGETIVGTMVRFMGSSNPLSVRIEGFKLAQCLMLTEEGCSRVVSMCCEPIVEAIVCAINEGKLKEGKGANDQIPLMIEACRLAMITRWPGKHRLYFWKKGIDKVLVDILLPNFVGKYPSYHTYTLEEQIAIARENLIDNPFLVLRPYVWDILGWLSIRYAEDFDPKFSENEAHFDVLTAAACVAFEDIIGRGNQLCHDDVISTFRSESAVRVVLMMIFSSCKYISSKARSMLCEVLNPNGERYLKQLLYTLKSPSFGVNLGMPNMVHIVISLIGLTCFLALPHYQGFIVEGSKALLSYMMGRSSESFYIPRSNYALHLKSNLPGRACCFLSLEEWEGKDVILFHNLWGLSVSIHHSGSKSKCSIIAVLQTENVKTELVNKLLEICKDTSNCGARWFASYILTYFSYFGFPSEGGVKIGKALSHEDYADIELILGNGTSFCVHGVLLMVRCPLLLPPEQPFDGGTFDNSSVTNDSDNWRGKFRKEIRLSSHVNRLELEKLLEYVYSGYVQVEEDTVKRLKILARHSGLHHLSELLSRRFPEWAIEIPSFDLKPALGQGKHMFWDIILESKATELSWTCSICSMSVPHMHVHRIILWASCDYLQALLQSGMQESQSQILKVVYGVTWVRRRSYTS